MSVILRKLPYFDNDTFVTFPRASGPLLVRGSQVIVWVALTRITDFNPSTSYRFPAILDTGFSHNFAIGARQLFDWAGLEATVLPHVGSATISMPGLAASTPLKVSRHEATVWLYRNEPAQREPLVSESPFDLQIDGGVIVYPRGFPAPRLPLLGLRGLQRSKLRLLINSDARHVSIRSPVTTLTP